MVANSNMIIGFVDDGGKLVAFCRVLTDFVFRVTVYDVIVAAHLRGRGAASGHELLNRIELNPNETLAVLRSAKVKYRRPANGRLLALAVIDEDSIRLFGQQFAGKGRGFIDVTVHVVACDGEEEVFAGDFSWLVSRSN